MTCENNDYGFYKKYLKSVLSEKRYTHSINVAEEAYKLALKYNEDTNKAYLCGVLHDICKEMPVEEQERYVFNSQLNVSEVEKNSVKLWHGISGAEFICEKFGIKDADILNAIRYHTVAKAGMTTLEEIVYLADLISADRQYDDVERMREVCYKSLKLGMLEALRFIIPDLITRGKLIPVSTIEAYNQYLMMT